MVKIVEINRTSLPKGSITVRKNRVISAVDDKIFGSFIEHVGRSVYNGIYEPAHETADENGFRQDVIAAVRELRVSCVRYPGGNFVSGYNWKDGIGKKTERPVRLNLAWKELEPNRVGTDEFMLWAKKAGCEPAMAVNMGNGTPAEAAELVEYCNMSSGTYWADKRKENGHTEPYGIRFWCVGNEMDGDYQLGALPAEAYGKKAYEAAKQMKRVDESIQLIMAGSSSPWSPTFPEWDRAVLRETYKYADFLSLHAYYTYKKYEEVERALPEFLASPVNFEQYITAVKNLCDEIRREKNGDKDVMLAVDEWNVWHTAEGTETHEKIWRVGEAIIENSYDMADALVVGGLLSVLVNHCDRVKIACMAQLVNVIAPIFTEVSGALLKQTTYYPFSLFALCKGMDALVQDIETDGYSCDYGWAPYLYSSVCYDRAKSRYYGYFINVSENEYDLHMNFGEDVTERGITELYAAIHEKNTFTEPQKIVPRSREGSGFKSARQQIKLRGYSFNLIEWQA